MRSAQPTAATTDLDAWRITFVERLGAMGDVMGLSRTVIRLLGWLVVCDPPYQSAPQLQVGLRLSAGTVSSAMNTLVRDGLVQRVTLPADRHHYYKVEPDGWKRLLAGQLQVLGEIRAIADQAMAGAGGRADDRLVDMQRFYARCEPMLAEVLDRVPS